MNTRYNAQAADDLHQQSGRSRRQHRSAVVHLPARRAHALAADRDVRLDRDVRRRRARGRPARVGRRHRPRTGRPPRTENAKQHRSKLPPQARSQARAQLRAGRGDGELKWTGGQGGVVRAAASALGSRRTALGNGSRAPRSRDSNAPSTRATYDARGTHGAPARGTDCTRNDELVTTKCARPLPPHPVLRRDLQLLQFQSRPARRGAEAALRRRADRRRSRARRSLATPADTIYFGGGTPSLLSGAEVARILAACRESFALAGDSEITLEANPETVSPATLEAYRAAGVNRLSFGVQSFRDDELARLGRLHSADTARAGRRDGAPRRVRQRQPRPDDVAAAAARRSVARVGRCA